ncbi:MAG TPA: alcohol dehydrogenase catalytic domain-containing protein [Firmicutes bacterium]|nr:alcohol dehydrogenase catalytic domain-containing protein [Bacillota bacterium]
MAIPIPKMMQAVVVYGPHDYRLEERTVPKVGPGEVLVKVLATGICASDVKTFHGLRVWGSSEIPPYIEAPVTAGHEFIGEVVALGEGAAEKYDLAVGDMAVSEQIIPCWRCRYCRRGQYWMCQQHDIYGFKRDRAEGAWAQYMKYPANALNYRVPKEIRPELAATIEPLACAIHAVERADIQLGDVVVIAGMGAIGLFMLQVARMKGPGLLVAIDLKSHRLELARRLGADVVINPSTEDPVEKVLDMTDQYGCDVYIEASGAGAAVPQGLKMIRKLGTFVEFSVHSGPIAVDWSIIGDVKELNIHGAHLSPYAYPKAIRYLKEGRVNADLIVTHKLSLEDYHKGIELVHEGNESVKVVLIPSS